MQSDSVSRCGEMADSFKRCEIDSRKAVNFLTSLAIVRFFWRPLCRWLVKLL